MLTADATRRINKFQVKELLGMPVGQIVGEMNNVRPAKDVIFDMVEEFIEVTESLGGLVAESTDSV
jgi:NAD(P)H-dependent flavin oxidoreductase YrpB (nitropropane dioxygenase family)